MLKHCFFLSFFIFILVLPCVAQDEPFTINGNNVSYDRANHLVEAIGSVEAVYKDVILTGAHVIYNTKTEQASAESGFSLYYQGITIEGRQLEYSVQDQVGTAKDVMVSYDSIVLKGKNFQFDPQMFNIHDAYFSTCDENHYHVSASDLEFDHKNGWLVAHWGFFWFMNVPLIPMPTFIYDLDAAKKGRKNLPPFPEISSNHEDGLYIEEKLAWHLKRELSGTYSLTYASKKGFGLGAEANYILNSRNSGNARIYNDPVDATFGGITHSVYLGQERSDQQKYSFFTPPKYYDFELQAYLTYHERINYQRISFLPLLLLKQQKGELFSNLINYYMEVSYGTVDEKDNTRLNRGRGEVQLYKDIEAKQLQLTPKLGLITNSYSNDQKWENTIASVDLKHKFNPGLIFGLGYSHYLENIGVSPFAYEMYRFNPKDRIYTQLDFALGAPLARFYAAYFTDNWRPDDIDYSLFFKMHCYNIGITYRSMRGEFNLGFELLGF